MTAKTDKHNLADLPRETIERRMYYALARATGASVIDSNNDEAQFWITAFKELNAELKRRFAS